MGNKWRTIVGIFGICCLVLCMGFLYAGVAFGESKNTEYIGDEEIPMSSGDPSLVTETEEDYRVIPDKYNTGAKGDLTQVGLGDVVDGIQLKVDGTGAQNVLDFYYRNKDVSGVVIFEDMDFSLYPLLVYNSDKVEDSITLIFNNCKFSTISTSKAESKIKYEFNNCTFQRFSGSDATFTSCKFGDHYLDCIIPFQNIYVQDCFISNMSVVKSEPGEVHSDGTHLYGHKDVPIYNVVYDNCRFEVPAIEFTDSYAIVNACFMLQLEYNDATDIFVNNCIMNGGGYTIFARSTNSDCTMENVVLQNIRVGCAKRYGTFYPRISSEAVLENIVDTDSLYVASVWKEDDQTHFSVTNDTNRERTLEIITDKGRFSYTISACPTGDELPVNCQYDELPFDIDIVVPEDCEYAVCYDATIPGAAKQIRFVNWTGEIVYLETEQVEELFSGTEESWYSGQCGDDVWYELDKAGCLTVWGTGATNNYHSAKRAPWYEYRDYIKEVIVEEGITCLGAQIFKDCSSIQNVTLPEGLEEIKTRAFDDCVAIRSIYWPGTLQAVEGKAFEYNFMYLIEYAGTDIYDILSDEDELETVLGILEYVATDEKISVEAVLEGDCGDDCYFTLYSDGTLLIEGTGEMTNYHSTKSAPWFDCRESVYKVVIEEGITKIGNQAFRKCKNLCEVVLPDGLVSIGANAFISCSSLTSICIPASVEDIGSWAFSGTNITSAYYAGTEEQWNMIQIGKKNEDIIENVIFEE